MSEREKLHNQIALLIAEVGWPAQKADAVIRLVVEACCARAREKWIPSLGRAIGDDLRSTFLPTPTQERQDD